ncbi:MAG: hypothetical protein IT260_17225 [Saprospiraceae bacterium]|nr:hypothetical protein [Saprospiraceae bacterium]
MKQPLFGLLCLFVVAGCSDTAEPIPAYVRIEPFTVNADGGAAWQKLTEAWIYVDNDLIGGYTLPATVPVLAEGESSILIFPGVRENGLTQTPSVYPLMTRYETKATFTPAETTTLTPSTAYSANVVFPWTLAKSSFDNSSIVLENRDADTATTFTFTTDGAFSGRSLKLAVEEAHPVLEIATELVSDLPGTDERPVWLEMNYQCDMPFQVWLLGKTGTTNEVSQAVYQFAPSAEWNKIYLNLTSFLITLKQDQYRLFFRCTLPQDQSGKYTQPTGTVLLDNVRLIYY